MTRSKRIRSPKKTTSKKKRRIPSPRDPEKVIPRKRKDPPPIRKSRRKRRVSPKVVQAIEDELETKKRVRKSQLKKAKKKSNVCFTKRLKSC